MSIVPLLIIFVIVAMLLIGVMRFGSHYIDFSTITGVMESLPADQVHTMRLPEIRDVIEKRLKINNIRDLNVRNIIKLDRDKESTRLRVQYEIRDSLFYNIDIVLKFDETFQYK